MTERARHVYAIIRTLFAWTPGPKSRSGLQVAARGFVAGRQIDEKGRQYIVRYITCPDCLTNDRVLPTCETCLGRGEIPDDGPDPYDRGVASGVVRGKVTDSHRAAAENDFLRATKNRDLEITRMERQTTKPARKIDEHTDDALTRAIAERDRLYKQGSYREVWQQLERLRDEKPSAYHVALMVAYQPLGEEPIEPIRNSVTAVCELIASRIEGPIRVPDGIPIWTRDELEARSKIAREAIAHGRTAWASGTRADRKRLIMVLASEGLSDGQIARRLGLTRGRVQQIRSGIDAALEDAAA